MYNPYRNHVPNQIPLKERLMHIGLSMLLLAYGTYGLWVNDIYVPGRGRGMHFHDTPAWLLYGAIVCACLVMMSVVIDHYDRRNNEKHYRTFAKIGEYLGWSLVVAAFVWSLLSRH